MTKPKSTLFFGALNSTSLDLSTTCLQYSFVYNASENTGCFALHFFCIVGIEVLRDRCVSMTEPSCNVHWLCSSLNELCCMSMTKAMCVEPHCFEKSENRLVTKRNTVRADTDQGLSDTTIWRWDFFREYEQGTISVCTLVYDLICLAKLHLILCLFTLECVKIG